MTEIIIKNLQELLPAAKEFLNAIGPHRVIALYGGMGAGKTTFVSAIGEALGVEDDICSPTFTIVNEYADREGSPIFHFDFYRINSLKEAMETGLDEYFYSGSLCLIEWPEKIEELLPDDTLRATLTVNENGERILRF
ncbi:MAG: tRNA (adenosine(37)-N6)-threonylcarbamoyltransferase complex ATPase subunit type 1 TsaE [Bacteroidales bacterium]|nr:tRNA (adenosine(37)-N6)-threonylcarbamoyltransferase complex ATPase subunit type 1 TsaE [Bacteroidales bacterium]